MEVKFKQTTGIQARITETYCWRTKKNQPKISSGKQETCRRQNL